MTHYDYRAGKKRIDEILDARMPIETSLKLPSTDNLTFENAYNSWISALFVDIRNSTASQPFAEKRLPPVSLSSGVTLT